MTRTRLVPKNNATRIPELDALRGLAAIAIVLFHYTYRFGQIYAQPSSSVPALAQGQYAIYLFFMLSGFVILMSREKTVRPFDFLVSRFSRLYPTFWVAVCVSFAIVAIFSLPGREVSLTSAIVNLTMLPQLLNIPLVDGVYWTLTIELMFYAAMFVLILLKLHRRIELVSAVWLMVLLLYQDVMPRLGLPTPLDYCVTLNGAACYIIAGMMFYKIKTHPRKWHLHAIVLFSFAVLVGNGGWSLAVASALFYALFYAVVFGWLKSLAIRPLVFLGTVSYPLYLLHQNIGFVILRGFYSIGASPWVAIPIAVLIVLALATAVAFLLERPANSAIRRRYAVLVQSNKSRISRRSAGLR